MAWAGQWFHVPCTVVVPENNNPEINRIVESLGADLITHGRDFYDAQSYCDELVDSAGYYYVEQGNEPEILNGLGTMGLEIFEDLPDVDVIICPIGGGSGCASLIKWPRPSTRSGDHRRAARAGRSLPRLPGEGRAGYSRSRRHRGRRSGRAERLPASYAIMKDRVCRRGAAERRGDPGGHPAGACRPRTTWPKAPGPHLSRPPSRSRTG